MIIATGLLVGLVLTIRWRYLRWLEHQGQRTSADSKIAHTEAGVVEYDIHGDGPVILHFHGGNVGHNGWFMLEHLVAAGYTLLTPDRPGYLGTPLEDNGSPAAQADLMAALLDTLGIQSVAIIGVSAGGPAALQFALRYPQRTQAIVLLSAITKQTGLSDEQMNSTLGKLVMSKRVQNLSWLLIQQAMKRMPRLALQDYVKTETTYNREEGKAYIDQIVNDPVQFRSVYALADAAVPALPRFEGVMNDLHVQQHLDAMPLAQIQAPTLIIHSQRDGDVPFENAEFAAEAIPNVELIAVEQFGHMIWWGDATVTQDFQNRIERFLEEHVVAVATSPRSIALGTRSK